MNFPKWPFYMLAVLGTSILLVTSCGETGGKMTGFTVEPSHAVIVQGTNQQFTAKALFSDGTTIEWTSAATWEVQPENAGVSISNSLGSFGLATSSSGTGSFTMTASNTGKTIMSSAILSVVDPLSIEITPANPFLAVGKSFQMTATALLIPDGASPVSQNITGNVSWSVSPPTGAAVSGTGLLEVSAAGQYILTASHILSGVTGSTVVTVTNTPVESIEISPSIATISAGTTTQMKAFGNFSAPPEPGDFTRSVAWSSSEPAIASVDPTGLVSAGTTTGSAIVSATDPITGQQASATVTVIAQ